MDDPTLLSWIERGQNVAALLVAIGVAAEFVLGFMAVPARHRLEQTTDAELLRLTTNSQVLENQTVDLRNKNLQLEQLIQPRDLSLEEQKAIGNTLQTFTGKFVLVLALEDPEAMRLGELIASAVSRSGIVTQLSPLAEGMTMPPRTGVEVVIGTDQQFVKVLSDALFSQGHLEPAPKLTRPRAFAGGMRFVPNVPKTPDATVYVGMKPLKFLQQNGLPP